MMNEYNQKTAIRTRRMPFRAGLDSDPEHGVNVLPLGTHLGEFEILDLIGEGGFGIVYLAYDHSLERHVALKEYMPSGLATRTTTMAVTVRSQHNLDTFTAGLKSFINEARMLAQFDSPSLVKVHRFWEGNGTAYMVMPFYEGTTLKQALKEHRITPTESWIRMLLADLFDAIETIHRAQCFHRDIAPDNILLLKDGRPLLLDFGAARRVIGDLTQCLTVILKPGFAPIEQYADIAGLRQGAWTDIYALAAVVYYLITGKAPPPAVARMVHDEMVPARIAGKGRYGAPFLTVLDKALSVKPEQRYKSIAELRHALDIMETVPRTLPRPTSHWAATDEPTTRMLEPKPEPEPKPQPAPAAKPEVKAAAKAKTKAEFKPDVKKLEPKLEDRPAAPPQARPQARTTVAPEARGDGKDGKPQPAKPGPKPATAMPSAAAAWQKSQTLEHSVAGSPAHDRLGWLVLALLFGVGIASGIYLGMHRSWNGLPEPSTITASKQPAPAVTDSSGSSGSSGSSDSSGSSGSSEMPEPASAAPAPSAPPPAVVPAPGKPAATGLAAAAPAAKATDSPQAGNQPSPPQPPLAAEEQLWQLASSSDKASLYKRYLKKYPKGLYAAVAKMKLEERLPKTAMTAAGATAAAPAAATAPTAAVPAADDELWRTASAINQAPAYEAYLNQFPHGHYAQLARDKLATDKLARAKTAEPEAATPPPAAAAADATPPAAPAALPAKDAPTPATPAAATAPPPEPAEKLASIKPGPAETTPPAPAPEAALKPAPAPVPTPAVPKPAPSPATAGSRSLVLADQTMLGNFSVDPQSGIVSGTGKIIWNNGNQFDGTLVRGKKEGKGQFVWSNGQRYKGDWARDMPNGKGTITFANGNRYTGDVKNGVPQGHGVIHFKSGDAYDGAWVAGKSHGHGRYTWANGSYWEGEFQHDQRTADGKMVFSDSALRSAGNSAPATAGEASGAGQAAVEKGAAEK
jgi:serine/threonine protein kinase